MGSYGQDFQRWPNGCRSRSVNSRVQAIRRLQEFRHWSAHPCPDKLLFPNEEAIKATFGGPNCRVLEFFDKFTIETCPRLNSEGATPDPDPGGPDNTCRIGNTNKHGGMNPTSPRASRRTKCLIAPSGGTTSTDPYLVPWFPVVQSFCEYKGIVYDEVRLAQEADTIASVLITDRRHLAPHRSCGNANWAVLNET